MLRRGHSKEEDETLDVTAIATDSDTTEGDTTDSDKSGASSFSSLSGLEKFVPPAIPAKQAWNTYKDLEINPILFARGIVAIRAASSVSPPQHSETDGTYFSMSSRVLSFGSPKNVGRGKNKTIGLLQKLEAFCGIKPRNIENGQTILFNENRREEVFLPFSLLGSQQKTGFYLYPWLSPGEQKLTFTGFKKFVTASCMLGSSLKGIDENGGVLELIKHDIKFYPLQKITGIDVNLSSFSAYETAFFSGFKKLTLLMKQLSKNEENVQLYYHLPYLDYMLFGVSLFIRGRITLKALNDFFKAILIRKEDYIKILEGICTEVGITLQVQSPFENLFGTLPKPNGYDEYTKLILSKLGIRSDEIEPTVNQEDIQANEKTLVQHCLGLLQKNTYHLEHQTVWQSFSSLKTDEIDSLEKLFTLANAIMIALAANGQKPHETCSLLPLSEKQIQVSYTQLNKALNPLYPAVFNMTTLDPIIAYEPGNPGLLFSFRNCQDSIKKLVAKKEILSAAHENISRYAENHESIALETILKKGKFL